MPNLHKTLFNPSQKYMSILKKSYRFIKETNYQPSNLTTKERVWVKYLSENRNITIKRAVKAHIIVKGKGSDIVIKDTGDYVKNCELHLNDKELYEVPLHEKWSFPLRISSVDVSKSAVSCGFGHIYRKNP